MTLRNPSRRVTKSHRGIGLLTRLTTATKTKLFAAALLPRALTLGLNLTPVFEPPVVQAAETATATDTTTLLAFDATQPVPLTVDFEAYSIVKQPSRAEAAAREKAARKVRERALTTPLAVAASPVTAEPDLQGKRALAQDVAREYGIDWRLLEAVWQVESGKSWQSAARSSAGAQGPMQFMPGTWRRYGVDGNGDGRTEATNVYDALHSGARYLAANGAADGNIDRALFAYNHAGWYVQKVKTVMSGI